ncbi:hypothetical protein CBR_g34905 [Chara braunii]|uniref:Reverse transcriptase domain-containing protein n=1 Tax=Chara braunii TaxID=69332 RepID=A0A388LJN6_CHABU|nr:hypothetical protein CBR_g34905 [Chara braunii]|eukprot:GBG82529.1 hypothetical protein CBR_g34905 [Chara braunii]
MREQAASGPCRINEGNEEKLMIGEPDFLSPQERALMVGLMKKRRRAHAFNDDQRGRLDVDKIPMIRIHMVPHEPWNLRGTRYPNPDEAKMVVDYLDGKMRTHVADYSSGPYASSWFCFVKLNWTLRWVQDLQRLNAVMVRDAGGLPNADALSESCAGRPIISLIDLYSGYDQFPVYPPDRPVTTLHTPRGLIHMNVAPQGWTNAVAMVQRHMIKAMQTVSPHITQPYIDDLAVKGPKEREEDEVIPDVRRFVWKHIKDLDRVLSLLEEYNLTASGPKSNHCMREATILGFVCNENGRRPDVKKTDKIVEWSGPFRSITDVRSSLGTCGFWRSFVKNFVAKTEHLRKLALARREEESVEPAQATEPPPTHGLEQVEFRQITGSDLRDPSPELPEGGKGVPLETPLGSLEAHLDASQWGTSQLGAGPVEPARYEPAEELQGPDHEPGELQAEEVITVGDNTPPHTPVPELVRRPWPEGIPEPDSEEIPVPPSESITSPPKRAEPDEQEESERAEACTIVTSQRAEHVAEQLDTAMPASDEPPPKLPHAEEGMSAEVPPREVYEAQARRLSGETAEEKSARVQAHLAEIYEAKVRMEAAGETPTPPVDPRTSEQRVGEAWARYEGRRDAARLRSRKAGQEDERTNEIRETEDLGFSAARMAIERAKRRIRQAATTSFQRYTTLSDKLATSRLEVEQLSTQLAEEKAENQAWRSRMEVKEAE